MINQKPLKMAKIKPVPVTLFSQYELDVHALEEALCDYLTKKGIIGTYDALVNIHVDDRDFAKVDIVVKKK